ncbi:MAG: AsmA-like C-terminal region-containing protein [Brumimicrobium sp.]
MTKKKDKKNKSLFKKILIYSGIGFLVLLIAMILTPIFFKDKLKDMAIETANTMLKADVALGDFDLTIISTFPKMKLSFENVSITGRDEFEDIKLVDLKKIEAKLDFWSVINMENISIRSIEITEPSIHVKILEDGNANYDIVKSEEELEEENVETETAFELNLDYFDIISGDVFYEDLDTISPMFAGIQGLTMIGSGRLTGDKIKFETENTIQELAFQMGEEMDLSGRDIILHGDIDLTGELSSFDVKADLGEFLMKMTDQEAVVQNFTIEGNAKMSDKDLVVETKTNADEISYMLGAIPYLTKVKTDLDLDLVMDFLDDGYRFTLADNNLQLNALSLSFDGFYEYLESGSDMDLKLITNQISFKNLLSLVPAFYHTGYESMIADGSMNVDGYVKGKLNDNSYPSWNFNAGIKNASIKYPDLPESINNINIQANTKFPGGSNLDDMTVDIDNLNALFAGNKIDGNFYLSQPMSDPSIRSQLNLDIDLATIEKVYPLEEKYSGKLTSNIELEGKLSAIEEERYQDFHAKGQLRLQNFNYDSEDLPDPVYIDDLTFNFSPRRLQVAEMNAKMGESNFAVNGELSNYMNYLFKENEDLVGNLNVYTNYLNVDDFMPAGTSEDETTETVEESTETGDEEPILIPKHINFVMKTNADRVVYDGMNIDNLKGVIIIKDQEANLQNLSADALGGSVTLNGKYNTQNKNEPKADFGWSLKNLRIKELADNFITVDKIAPIAKFLDGNISSDFSMNTSLKPNFEPVFNTLNGEGNLFSSSLDILGFEPLNELASKLNISKLSEQTIKNVRASFSFENGKVEVKPFDVKLGNINTLVSGTTSFEQEIDFKLEMMIPKEDIPNQALDLAEKGIAQVKKIPGFDIKLNDLPNEIPVTAFITNTIKNPKVTMNLQEKLMELGGNVKEGVKDLVDAKVEEAKDSVREVIEEKKEEVKEEVNKEIEAQRQKIINEAQVQADKIISEAKKLADKTREEANKNGQKLIDEAGSNFLKKKTAEAAAGKIRDEGEKAAQKIENEAQTRADNLMKKARENASKIGI